MPQGVKIVALKTFGVLTSGKFFLCLILLFGFTINDASAQVFRSKSRKRKAVPDSLRAPEGSIEKRVIYGKVSTAKDGEELPLAVVRVAETTIGNVAKLDGSFSLVLDVTNLQKLVCSYQGYYPDTVTINQKTSYVHFKLKEKFTVTQDVVVSASRKLERKFESPVSVEMLSMKDLQYNTSMNLYDRISNLSGIDVITTSVTFKTFNTRGFNSSYNHRFIQRFDNMDLSMPGFNLSLGMLNGPIDLDVERTELIPGSSSAVYGPNAITGLLNIVSKSPYKYKGLSVNLKTGVNHVDGIDNAPSPITDFSFRYANTLPNEKWAYKITFGLLQATDWKATDYRDNANYTYSDNLTAYGFGLGKGNPGYEAANISGDEITSIFDSSTFKVPVPGGGSVALVNNPLKISRTGYQETDIFSYQPYNIKSDLALHYKPNKNTHISLTSRFSRGSSSFQIDSRAQIEDFFLHQHKFEVKGKNYVFRTFAIFENTGHTFDITTSAIALNRAAKEDENWMAQYLFVFSGYYNTLNSFLGLPRDTLERGNDEAARRFADGDNNEYSETLKQQGIDSTLTSLLKGRAQFKPGSKQFDSALNVITNRSISEGGGKLLSLSKSWYTEFIYDFVKGVRSYDLTVGVGYRLNAPATQGTIFRDEFAPLYSSEIGVFTQASKTYLGGRLKMQASARLDKMQRFKPRFSPRASVVYLAGKREQHSFRLSGQIGFRMPALIDQFNYLDLDGALTLGGFYSDASRVGLVRRNPDGSDFINMYFQNSVTQFLRTGNESDLIKPLVQDIVPEELRAIELGWRSFLFEKLETDMSFFVSNYRNLINVQQFVGPANTNDTVSPEYVKDLQNTIVYRMSANSQVPVTAFGYSFALNYYLNSHFSFYGNYNFNHLNETPEFLAQDFIGTFNTPKHKVNLGVTALRLKKHFGFSANFRWVDRINFKEYNKEGIVDAYYNLDMMVSYTIPKYKLLLKLGGTNVTNVRYSQALGSPTVGAVYYFSILFDELL